MTGFIPFPTRCAPITISHSAPARSHINPSRSSDKAALATQQPTWPRTHEPMRGGTNERRFGFAHADHSRSVAANRSCDNPMSTPHRSTAERALGDALS